MIEDIAADLYNRIIDQKVTAASMGVRPSFDSASIVSLENRLLTTFWRRGGNKLRHTYLLGIIYDGMSSINVETLMEIGSKVRHPVLDAALAWYFENSKQGKEAFQKLDTETDVLPQFTIRSYLRAAVLLRLVSRHPDIIPKLESSSAYFPHRLFQKSNPLLKEIEAEIAFTLLTLFPDGLIQKISCLDELIKPTGNKDYALLPVKLGRYFLPSGSRLYWTSLPDSELILNNIFSDLSTRKDVYCTLIDCLNLIRSVAEKRGDFNTSYRPFYLSNTKITVLLKAIGTFAKNQLRYAWESTGGSYCPASALSRTLTLTARIEGEKLVIYDRGQKEYYTKGSPLRDTQSLIPFCSYVLLTLYKKAEALNPQSTKT